MQAITGTTYIGKDLYNILTSVAILAISFVYWSNFGSERNIRFILGSLLLITAASAFKLLATVIPHIDYSTISGAYYLKNSVSFVFLSVITLS